MSSSTASPSSSKSSSCCGGGSACTATSADPSVSKLLAFALAKPSNEEDALTALRTLSRILFNIVGDPDEPKFRRLRSTNAAIARLKTVPGAWDALLSFGFSPDPADADFLVLPSPALGREEVAAAVTEGLASLEDAIASRESAARRAELEEARVKREAAEAERKRLVSLAKREQEERKGREADKSPASSKAAERAFGAKASTWKDIGVDLSNCNKGG